ncbi:hypothetical protein D030_1129A, partial [Vibrio parahaemolyticus AQ3810]
MADFQFAVTVG